MCRAGATRELPVILGEGIMFMLKARATRKQSQTQVTTQHPGIRVILGAIAITLLSGFISAQRAQAQTLNVLHSFGVYSNDGSYPQADLIRDSSGNIYGTTEQGGSNDTGTVFKIDATGNLTILHNFAGSPNDGAFPVAGLVLDSSGNLYGTTRGGGPSGDGIVFKVATSGNNYSILHSFSGSDGAYPYASLIMDSSGNLYGTTCDGGVSNDGTVFKLGTSGGNFAVLHSFSITDGAFPVAGLVMDSSGNLYGTAYYGGSSYSGTVFKLAASGNFTVLHNFAGYPNDGAYSLAGLVIDASNNLYGTTSSGGAYADGMIFKLDTAGTTYAALYNFSGLDGTCPYSRLILGTSGSLYGTTSYGGSQGNGTVFKLDTSGNNFAVLDNFSGGNGANPQAGLLLDPSGNLFGTTYDGGSPDFGTVFEIATTSKAGIQGIIDQINALCAQGVLNKGQANSLIQHLQNSQRMVAAGQTNAAIATLEGFIGEVDGLINSGTLTSQQGAGLLNSANATVMQLQAQ
jgi:uncharacterized repeat protein (TIGR03803 family)